MTAFLEVSALFERQWTGIPTVVAALAEHSLTDASIDWQYLYETILLPRKLVEGMLIERSGDATARRFRSEMWNQRHVDYAEAARSCAIFTNIKPMRGLFGREAMVVYDLSPILTPQFHNPDNIGHFANRFRADVETSSHFFPISRATRGDLETYFGVKRQACTVLPMGVNVDPLDLSHAQSIARTATPEPYVVVLGTLEPRKNGGLVLDYLARNPGFAQRYKVVFVGRDGWLEERERLVAQAVAAGVPPDQVVFTGYVSETEKVGLLYNAAFCIYASFFEGYGLPILEASLLGKLIVCSNSSSMPEVAPERCFFFDPSSVLEFARAVSYAEKRSKQLRPALSLEEVQGRLAQHGWDRCYESVRGWASQ